MAEGTALVADEEVERALEVYGQVISLAPDIDDPQLVSLAHFWSSRCLRKAGGYDRALTHLAEARRLAAEAGCGPMSLPMLAAEAWILFQKGKTRDALNLLEQASTGLDQSDDYITRGNVQSSYGRMYRRDGRYELAQRHFTAAIEEYRKRDPEHRNLTRSLANLGLVERLIALQYRKQIDAAAALKKRSEPELRAAWERQRAGAMAHLDQAGEIYHKHANYRGSGTVHINRGHLLLDSGDLQQAADEARAALRFGEEKHDRILIARARLLECMVQNAMLEEEIEDPAWVAHRALEAAKEAVECARQTENKRLLARALIWHGMTICATSPSSLDAARDICDHATNLLKNEVQDHIWEDLQALKARVVRGGDTDEKLREWSQGVVGDRSFQQLTEDFADLIIPRVWANEGRKVARVARRLSISPKKVRRVLNRLGLHGGTG
jgi:tetratricopeptide (TPR) repeat protein